MAEYYEKINWKNGAEGETPLSAENFNHMEEGISGAEMRTGPLEYDKENDTFSAGNKIQLDTNGNLKVSGTITDGNNNVLGTSISIDSEISDTSENPVQNKVIKSYIDDITGDINKALEEIIAIQEGFIDKSKVTMHFLTSNGAIISAKVDIGMTWAEAIETDEVKALGQGFVIRDDGYVRCYVMAFIKEADYEGDVSTSTFPTWCIKGTDKVKDGQVYVSSGIYEMDIQ